MALETLRKIFKAGDSKDGETTVRIRELHRRWSPHSTEGTDLVEDSLWDRIDLYMEEYTKETTKSELRAAE